MQHTLLNFLIDFAQTKQFIISKLSYRIYIYQRLQDQPGEAFDIFI